MRARDILAVVTSVTRDESVIAVAETLAMQSGGRLTVVLIGWQPNVAPVDGFVLDPLYAELVEDARRKLADERTKIENRLAQKETHTTIETYFIEPGAVGAVLGARARHADLTVVSRPSKAGSHLNSAILEAALFDSGRPVIVAPPDWKETPIGRNVLVAWKPTREAARAVGDADAFILDAGRVSVVTVDASPDRGYGERPGADITAHLAYRGAKAELFNLDAAGRSETRAILDQAMALGADLIVMGGYGRSRLSEFIFGGITREILKSADRPVLMSH
jgi:nucleotide-binding universal stress UspA family protein